MSFTLTILGSSSAVPTKNRQLSAHLLQKDGRLFLIDCAEGTQFQLLKFGKKINKIEAIFISHLHGDHYYGIFGLLSTMSMLGREKELHLFAPESLEKLIKIQHEVENRILNFNLVFHPLNFSDAEEIYLDESIRVCSFPMIHSVPVCGFRFDEIYGELNIKKEFVLEKNVPFEWIVSIKKGGDYRDENGVIYKNSEITYRSKSVSSYAYCSDTAYNPSMIELLKNVNTLYHETTFLEKDEDKAIQKLHSTTNDASLIASECNTKQLIVGHFSSRYLQMDEFFKEISTKLDAKVLLAEDGLEIII